MPIDVEKIISDPSEYDEIARIIDEFSSENVSVDQAHNFCTGLTQVFGHIAKSGQMSSGTDKTAQNISTWIKDQLKDYEEVCFELLASPSDDVAQIAFEALLKLVMIQGKYCKVNYEPVIDKIIKRQINKGTSMDELWAPYIEKYDDIRFHFFRGVAAALEDAEDQQRAKDQLLPTFENFVAYPQEDEDLDKWFCGEPKVSKTALKLGKGNLLKVSSHKTMAQKAWLAFLNLPLNATEVKRILTVLHVNAIPNIAKPQLLMDFLTDSYNYGGPIALLALNSLFALIQNHNLDYPHFFKKLYQLLGDGSLFASTHRARFLRLLDLFLTSTHLPGSITASIIKRMARLCLFSPPGAIIAVIPFIYNQLKRHPTCMLMIHRNTEISGPEADPFNPEEADPQATGAIDSSLWEIEALEKHYQPNIATLARIFSQPFYKPDYKLEHFLSHSYETLYSSQLKRKGNGGTALEYENVKVFCGDNGFMGRWTN